MFRRILESEFDKHDPLFRIIVHDHPRAFGSLCLPNASHPLTLCWRSELIDPSIQSDPLSSAIWIGVDQHVTCLSPLGNVLFSIGLSSPILQIKHVEQCTIVMCEIQILAINSDYTIRSICDLREIADAVEMKDGKLAVTFIDGEKETFSI